MTGERVSITERPGRTRADFHAACIEQAGGNDAWNLLPYEERIQIVDNLALAWEEQEAQILKSAQTELASEKDSLEWGNLPHTERVTRLSRHQNALTTTGTTNEALQAKVRKSAPVEADRTR